MRVGAGANHGRYFQGGNANMLLKSIIALITAAAIGAALTSIPASARIGHGGGGHGGGGHGGAGRGGGHAFHAGGHFHAGFRGGRFHGYNGPIYTSGEDSCWRWVHGRRGLDTGLLIF